MTASRGSTGLAPDRLARIGHLVVINLFVGGMVGLERTVLPLLAESDFGVASKSAALAFVATFGVTKAVGNLLVGSLADAWGRRRLLILGWLFGVPVPVILMMAPSWSWVLVANVLLGANQALAWSMTVVMKVDLAHPRIFGRVIGWNEFAGYAGMSVSAGVTGLVAASFGLRPAPFYLGVGFAVAGLLLSLLTKDTVTAAAEPSARRIPRLLPTSTPDPRLRAAALAGLSTNLKDGVLWGLLPIVLATGGLRVEDVGAVVALYPMVWAISQLVFGPVSDRSGRRTLIAAGLVVQGSGVALFVIAGSYAAYLTAATIVGLGTGMVYPTLLAYVSHAADPARRASALGVYRFWRDLGYAIGALGSGVAADALGTPAAFLATAGICVVSATQFLVRSRDGSPPAPRV